MNDKVIGWEVHEKIAIGIPNPRSVTVMPMPEGLTREQRDRIDKAIEALNEMEPPCE
jgi:hypothetical protein